MNHRSIFPIERAVKSVLVKIVLLACPFWKQCQWHLHIFEFVHWCFKVEVTNIEASVSRTLNADDTVPYYVGGGNVCRPGREFAWAFDQVAACRDADSVGVQLLVV